MQNSIFPYTDNHGGSLVWLLPVHDLDSWVKALVSFVILLLVVFRGPSLFYRPAPRRPTRFAEGCSSSTETIMKH
jgi:hypothetical protein